MTPAHVAAQKGHTAALIHLVKAGCDVNQAAKNGWTPADIAAQNGLTAALAAAVLENKNNNNSKRNEKNRKKNTKKKEKKKARAASNKAAAEEDAFLVSEELAPSSGPGSERSEADSNNRTLRDGGVDAESDDSDWEVDRCRCIHCLELDNALASTA